MAEHNLLEYDHKAIEFVEAIALLAEQSKALDAVKATLLGISRHRSGLK